MTYGMQCFNQLTQLMTFDSSRENTQFLIDERAVSVAQAVAGLSISYPAYAGQKLSAVMLSPYTTGDIRGWSIQSCRVSYSGTVPVVTVFYDNPRADQKADGYLVVFASGVGAGASGAYGAVFYNQNSILNISDTMQSYVYLGKYTKAWYGAYDFYLDITCVGVPVCFFSVPYGNFNDAGWDRMGVFIKRIQNLGANQWRVYFDGNHPGSGTNPIHFDVVLRVFGRLDLNFPSGSGDAYGYQLFNATTGAIKFDSNLPMLRLAGNTYDIEIALSTGAGSLDNGGLVGRPAQWDTVVPVPFDMANKSICAGTRGTVTGFQQTGEFYDPGAGYNVYVYDTWTFGSGYWANGSTLYARKLIISSGSMTVDGAPIGQIDQSNFNTVYTRLAVIDNSQFP